MPIETQLSQHLIEGCNPGFGFFHVGKTAGSSIRALTRKLIDQGHTPPMKFSHSRLREVVETFPDARLSTFIRDPLERIISGFQSRLRSGRPRTNKVWTLAEAISFSFFSEPNEFLKALISDDDRLKSAALFAEQNIYHVARGYEYYYESTDYLKANLARFYYVGLTEEIDQTAHKIFEPCGIERDLIYQKLRIVHSSRTHSAQFLERFSQDELMLLKEHYSTEYEIYDCLRSIRNQQKN